ncbi:LysR family transcriptional regulator [Egicoccus sp. AB-alg2]|uniref:LysR family transcriptional regulator n=1 Tax=Egicoccus sp. AB-alg2 TaxID=3242693 RepID=UPI00359D87BD
MTDTVRPREGAAVNSEGSDLDAVNLNNVDLNLLVALDALLAERSVTRAAERLQRSQPALSAALKRLRFQFRDELLIRVGNDYELTPLAAQLKRRTALALADVQRVFATRATFDPTASDREFVIVASDYGECVAGRALSALLAREGPGVRLRFAPMSDPWVTQAEESLRAVDGLLLPHGYLPNLPSLEVHTDRWIAICSSRNTDVGDTLTLENATLAPFVLPFTRAATSITPVRQLMAMGARPSVVVGVEHFSAVPQFVIGTDRIGIMQEQLARHFAPSDEIRIVALPFDSTLREAFWWHPSIDRDPGHRWLRTQILAAGRALETSHEA